MKKCPHCGKEYPDDATACAIDEHPLDGSEEIASSQDKSPSAGFAIRVMARIIDAVFGFFTGYAGGALASIWIMILNGAGMLAPGWHLRLHAFSLATMGFAMLGNIAYHTFCEGIHGATLGKICCGICVLTEDMKPSNLKGALIRSLAYFFDAFLFGLVAAGSMSNSPLNQRYGDKWGKTVVVKIKELSPELRPPPSLFLLGLLAGAGCDLLLIAISLVIKVL